MAKTTGPINSVEASGSLSGLLTFSSSKGRSYVKKFAVPSQPKTANQKLQRIGFSMASKIARDWESLIVARLGAEAERKGTTARSLYIGEATSSWMYGHSMTPTGIEVTTILARSYITVTGTYANGVITWHWSSTSSETYYGWVCHIGASGSETNLWSSAVAATGTVKSWTQTDVVPGRTYVMKPVAMVNGSRWFRPTVGATVVVPA